MPAAVSVPIHLGQTARGLLRRLTPGAAAMGKRRDARRAAAHCLIQPGAAQAEAADSVPDGMPPDEASAQLAFISPASMWGAEAPQTVSPTVSVGQGGEHLGDCVAPRNRAAGDAPSSEVRPQRFTPEVDPATLPTEHRAHAESTLATFQGLPEDAHAVLRPSPVAKDQNEQTG